MNDIRKQFEDKAQQLNEDAGRGRGVLLGKGVKKTFEDAMKFLHYDVMNRPTHHILKEEKYNFNNYYSLDIRVNTDKMLDAWEKGVETYEGIFKKIYNSNPEYEQNLIDKVRSEFAKFWKREDEKLALKNKTMENDSDLVPFHKMNDYWTDMGMVLSIPALAGLYDQIPVISIFTQESTDEETKKVSSKESIVIKPNEFVPLVMNGMASAIRGHVPQGVTIEEMLEGKFSRKAIAPEQGTFINRVKDPTSDKEFDFRSWSTKSLLEVHNIIMDTFKRDTSLKLTIPELKELFATPITRGNLFLYLKQDDFHQLEKGGEGISNAVKSILGQATNVANRPDV